MKCWQSIFQDFNKSALQVAPTGESGLCVLQKEIDELAFSSNHYPEFLPSKEFWKWAKIFTVLQESSVTGTLTFTECKRICYNSLFYSYAWKFWFYLKDVSVWGGLTFYYVFQQTISSCVPPFVILMLKYIVKKYLGPHFNKIKLIHWLAINFYIFLFGLIKMH